jgi:hypothetical protein
VNEAWLGGLAGGFGGLHDVLRAVIARKQQAARDAEGKEDRDFSRLAQMASLRNAGVIPESEASETPFQIPNLTEGMGRVATPSMPVNLPAAGRYRPVGEAGGQRFVQDSFRTPEAEERKRAALQDVLRQSRRENLIRAGAPEHQVDAALDNPSLADNILPKAEQARTTPAPQTIRTQTGDIYQWDAESRKWVPSGLKAPSAEARGESPVIRESRRAADRDYRALTDTRRGIRDLRSELGPLSTSADSARVMPELRRLRARADSLQGEFDKHSAAANSTLPDFLRERAGQATPLQRDLVRARQAYDASLKAGADSAEAAERYRRVVDAIRRKHSAGAP